MKKKTPTPAITKEQLNRWQAMFDALGKKYGKTIKLNLVNATVTTSKPDEKENTDPRHN